MRPCEQIRAISDATAKVYGIDEDALYWAVREAIWFAECNVLYALEKFIYFID